jgi:hypothetical protein
MVVESKPYRDWTSGRGCLPLERTLFAAVKGGKPRADGSVHIDADAALVETVHQWAIQLIRAEGPTLADTRANVRTGRSIVRQINPREFD